MARGKKWGKKVNGNYVHHEGVVGPMFDGKFHLKFPGSVSGYIPKFKSRCVGEITIFILYKELLTLLFF